MRFKRLMSQNAEVIHVSGHEVVVELENGKFELLNLGEDCQVPS